MRVAVPNLPPVDLGITETTPTVGITDYSRRVTDDFGVTTVVKRGFARRLSLRFAVAFEAVDALQSRLADLRATKATWIADDRFRALSVAGIYKDFSIDVVSQPCSFCTLTIDGFAETLDYPDTGDDPAVDGASTFRLLQPVTVTDAVLRTSSVPEDDAPAWVAGMAYAKGARVVDGHRVYESLIDGNVGNAPPSTQWLDVEPTNRWAMFDQALGSATTAPDGIVVILSSVDATALALLDVIGATVRVQGTGYDQERVVDGTMIFDGLPGGEIVVSIGGSGTVAVGTLLLGRIVALGVTETSPTAAITDYSRKDTNDFGDVTIVERAWAKRMSARTMFRTDALDLVFDRIAMVRATPSLWIGDEGTDALSVYGFFKDFSIEVGETTSKLSLQIEGLSKAAKLLPIGGGGGPVAWPDITDPDGTKPKDNADKTSENTSKDTNAVGGRPASDLLADVSALELAKVGTDAALGALDRAAGDSRAALAQVERDAGRIGETLLRLLAESERTRTVLRDAGIVVDPATGVVRIYAIDQIAERTASAEVRLDAATATISSKASVAYVQEQIALAVLDPGQAAQLEPIIARLTSAEQTISGVEAAVSSKAELIELTRVSGRVTTVSEDLNALAGTVSTKASRTDLDAQGARLGSVEETLATLDGVSSFGVTVRQARAIADGAAEAGLRALLAGDQAHRWQIVQQAEARTEMFAKLADQSTAEAVARQALSVQIGTVDARGLQESLARIAGDNALSTRISALSASNGELAAAIGTLESAAVEQGKGIAGITTTIRQQVADDDTTGEALLRALIAGDQTGRARAGQLVQVQTELSTTLVANEQAAAVARQSLLVRMVSAEAAIVTTSRALATLTRSIVERVSAAEAVILDPATGLVATRAEIVEIDRLSAERDKALGEMIEVVSASAGDAEAAVSKLATLVADGDKANAKLVEQVTAKLGDLGEATVQDLIEAVVTETGKILARRTVTVDVNGNLTGFALIGSEEGPGSLNLINTDLRMGTGRVVFDNGSAMRAQGNGFGKNRDLISWFGPSMPLDECTRANATSFEGTDGRAYFGGGLSAGIDKNAVQTSNTAADASVTTGPLASKGRRRTIVLSYVYSRFAQLNSGTANDRGASGATIELYRGTVRIVALQASGEWVRTRYQGASQPATYSEDLSGSITVNDDSGGTAVEYTARLITRSLGPGITGSPVSDTVGQNISIIQTEE